MPLFRCPYCKYTFDSLPERPLCPQCGKLMGIPRERAKKVDLRARKRKIEHIHREIEGRRKQLSYIPPAKPVSNPRIIISVGVVFLILALLFMSRNADKSRPGSVRTPVTKAMDDLSVLSQALGRFKFHVGRFPSETEGLAVLVDGRGIPGWDGSYIRRIHPDSWSTPYNYVLSNQTAIVFSSGPDHIPYTLDDIYADPEDLNVGTNWAIKWYMPDIRIIDNMPETADTN